MTGWRNILERPVDGASLAVARIFFGLIVAWEAFRYLYFDWVTSVFIAPKYIFNFPLVSINPWPRGGMYVHFAVLAIAGIGMSLGLAYRFSAWLVFIGLTYLFLLDASYSLDLNHFYLLCVVAGIFACVPAAQCWSLDRKLKQTGNGVESESIDIPGWPLLLLRFQIFIVYIFAGIAKLQPSWLQSAPASRLLLQSSSSFLLSPLLQLPGANAAMIYGGLFVDLIVPWGLLFRRSRAVAVAILLIFHLVNGLAFPIGIFPALASLLTLLFLDPGFPRWFGRNKSTLKAAEEKSAPRLKARAFSIQVILVPAFITMQVFLPMRPWLYPGPSGWSEEGHFFSWRMMTIFKRGTVEFILKDARTGAVAKWDPARELTPIQIESISTRPLLAAQYARHIADEVEKNEGLRPSVFVNQIVQYDDRPPQPMVDNTRNLADYQFSWGHYDWIIPLAP